MDPFSARRVMWIAAGGMVFGCVMVWGYHYQFVDPGGSTLIHVCDCFPG
jgi:hypothetical protein